MGRLATTGQWVKREFLELLPVVIFFMIGFNLIAFTKHLVLAQAGIVYEGLATATVGALVVAKVVLVANLLPTMQRYRGRPLYRPILYRTVLYSLCVLVFQLLEMLVGNAIHQGGLIGGLEAAQAEFVWAHFTYIQIWVFVLFLVYVTSVELSDEIGKDALRTVLFFGDKVQERR